MKFVNYTLLREQETHPRYFNGLEGTEFEGTVVGKVRPWDDGCREYVLYEDGDLILADLAKEQT